jgi:two-component system, OmpR family, phosphate regulon sensor histidine kinase PhoR
MQIDLMPNLIDKLRTGIIEIDLSQSDSPIKVNPAAMELLNIDAFLLSKVDFPELYSSRPDLTYFLKLLEQILKGSYKQIGKELKNYKRFEIYANGRYLNCYLSFIGKNDYLVEITPIIQQDISHTTHELKRPIQNIKALAETLLMGAKDEKELCEEYLKRLSRETDRLSSLVQDILSLSRLKNLHNSINKSSISLYKSVEGILENIESKAEERKIKLRNLVPQDFSILAEKELLEHLLENLIDNALNYNVPEGSLTVVAENDFIEIIDTGIGISETEKEKIFDQFFRVNHQNSQGSGLGLSIVKSIVDLHGWQIEVKSFPGKGSSFRVRIS